MKLMTEDKTKILLVDNHPERRPDLEAKLNQPAYCLVKVDSCIEGFRQLLEQNFSLIFVRILSEVDEALDLIKQLAKFHDIPVVFV